MLLCLIPGRCPEFLPGPLLPIELLRTGLVDIDDTPFSRKWPKGHLSPLRHPRVLKYLQGTDAFVPPVRLELRVLLLFIVVGLPSRLEDKA